MSAEVTARPKLLVISFDADDTIVKITGGVGHVYINGLQKFLEAHGKLHAWPRFSASEAMVEAADTDAVRAELRTERPIWAAKEQETLQKQQQQQQAQEQEGSGGGGSGSSNAPVPEVNPKEMPIGGLSRESIFQFWRRVLLRVFHNDSFWDFPPEGDPLCTVYDYTEDDDGGSVIRPPLRALGIPDAEWEKLFHHLIDDVFGSSQGYFWLKEGVETLQELSRWSAKQLAALEAHPETPPPLVPAALPFVVTNSDIRMKSVLRDLGAYNLGDGGTPLLGDVIAAMDVGRGKPSPRGLERCLELAGITSEEDRQRVVHIHVGDAPADEAACAAARHECHHVPCDPKVGVVWRKLLEKIEELSRDEQEEAPPSTA